MVRETGSGGRYSGRNWRTRSLRVRIEYCQPIRSAITVAGILGNAFSNSRIRGSTSSTTDPAGSRTYFGGRSEANATFTVLRATPITRATSEIDNCSDRRNRRLSAQSSTLNTRFLPGSPEPRVSRKLVKIQLPRSGQYSVAADRGSRVG
ncbi:hypothetical protein MAGR_39040 [Mycolicibacterium agri]|uniref:Uncharacterized protein n=1 Tax=Mycolicibacterium agri TaxID=36811 RepID=A0A7I9W432_MYCAG|nr:hypothetical protein MAGR_39040 [Mycolicibacterium agri]